MDQQSRVRGTASRADAAGRRRAILQTSPTARKHWSIQRSSEQNDSWKNDRLVLKSDKRSLVMFYYEDLKK